MAEEDLEEAGIPLQFSEPISWKVGRPPIAIATLMKRLKQLLTELCTLEQETVDRKSLANAARELCAPALLQHKDKGVKAFVACGLAEMLRLHAPDAPYTAGQLRDIFDLFVKQLRYLSTPDSPYITQYIHLLESLAGIKSIVLMADIPNGDNLIQQLFTYFFDIGAKPGIARTVEYHMSDILVQLVAECNSLPTEVVDIIVAQFLRANPTAVSAVAVGSHHGRRSGRGVEDKDGGKQTSIREHMAPPPPAYNMARVICTSLPCVDKMARHICQYFSEVILDASPSSRQRRSSLSPDPEGSPEPSGPHEPSEDDLKELSKAHLLVKELWRAAPSVLQNVIPQLEQELLAENVQLRLLATETIGDMCSTSPSPPLGTGIMGGATVGTWGGSGGSGSFASTCPASWRLWLGRVNDKSWVVRSKWVECAVRVLQTLSPTTAAGSNAAQALVPLIADKLNDTDERVRLATCRAIGEILDYASIKSKLSKANGGDKLLENLAFRAKDKKHSVRAEGMRVLAKMWDNGYEDIRRGDEVVVNLLGWIPGRLLETSYVNDKDVNVLLDCVMWEVLLPLEYPPGCLETGKKTASGKGKATAAKGKGKEKEPAKKPATRPQKPKGTLEFDDTDSELSDPPDSDEEEQQQQKEQEEDEEEDEDEAGDENNQTAASHSAVLDNDRQRTIRLLHLAHNLPPRSLSALLAFASRQIHYSKVLTPFLSAAADFNPTGGSNTLSASNPDGPSQVEIKARLTRIIDWLASQFPDPARSTEHLWKWVKMSDRRGWNLVKGMLSVDASWVQVVSNLKEVVKRVEKTPGGGGGMLETVLPLLYRSALLLWNKSHVPTIVEMSKEAAAGQKDAAQLDQDLLGGGSTTNGIDNALAITANVLLKEMSAQIPAVFKAHIASLTTIIQENAPPIPGSRKAAALSPNTPPVDPSIVDTLSALSTFAKKYPSDVPRDRKLHQALFALATSPLSNPKAAKHAVRVLMSAAMDKREMYATDLVQKCVTEWEWGGDGFIVRLGAVAEMVMVAPPAVVAEKSVQKRIQEICLRECLIKVRETDSKISAEYQGDAALNDEGKAKVLALKTFVNMLRATTANTTSSDPEAKLGEGVLNLLEKILDNDGEISDSPKTIPTPKSHCAALRLAAANGFLKLAATSPQLDDLVKPQLFNTIAFTAQDRREIVRGAFLSRLKRLLAAGRLSARWYVIVFLIAHEPIEEWKEETGVWIRARAKAFATATANAAATTTTTASTNTTASTTAAGKKPKPYSMSTSTNTMELILSRLISLLAHHPDFPTSPSNSPLELIDMARYLAYYIRSVVTKENIGCVYYIAGYIKRVKDALKPDNSENLYILSELAQALLKRWKDLNEEWVIESWPGTVSLPGGIFSPIALTSEERMKLSKEERKIEEEERRKIMERIRKKVFLPAAMDNKVLDAVLKDRKGRGAGDKGVNGEVGAGGSAAHSGGGKKRKSDGAVGAVGTASKKRRQSRSDEDAGGDHDDDDNDGDADGEDAEGGKKSKSSLKKKAKTPRKKRSSAVAGIATGTPKTPAKPNKRRRKSGGEDDNAMEGMSTTERRRSGRVSVKKVVYMEEEDEGTGEELEGLSEDDDDDEEESGDEESGEDEEEGGGKGEDEEDDTGGVDKMDVDADTNTNTPQARKRGRPPKSSTSTATPTATMRGARTPTSTSKRGPAKAKPSKTTPVTTPNTTTTTKRGRGRPRKVPESKKGVDEDGDEKMNESSGLSELSSEGEAEEDAALQPASTSSPLREVQEKAEDEKEGGGKEGGENEENETLEQALTKTNNNSNTSNSNNIPKRGRPRKKQKEDEEEVNSSGTGEGEGEGEVEGGGGKEAGKTDQVQKSPVKQMVLGRATRRTGK